MLARRKIARQRLLNCSRDDYNACIFLAKLTPVQKKIIDMYILDKLPVCEIATQLSFCESMIRRHLANVYDKVSSIY